MQMKHVAFYLTITAFIWNCVCNGTQCSA